MNVLVPPTGSECSFSSGPFLENDDVTKRKLSANETYSIGYKRAKKKGKRPNGDYLCLTNKCTFDAL